MYIRKRERWDTPLRHWVWFRQPCVEPGVGHDGPCGFMPTWCILSKINSFIFFLNERFKPALAVTPGGWSTLFSTACSALTSTAQSTHPQENCNRTGTFCEFCSLLLVCIPPTNTRTCSWFSSTLQIPFLTHLTTAQASLRDGNHCAGSQNSSGNKNSTASFISSLCSPPTTPANADGAHVQ